MKIATSVALLSTAMVTVAAAQPPGAILYSIYDANNGFVGTAYAPDTIIHEFQGVPFLVKATQMGGIQISATYLYASQNCTGQGYIKDDGDSNLFGTAYFDGNSFVVADRSTMVQSILVKSENFGGTCTWLTQPPAVSPPTPLWYVETNVGIPIVIKTGNPWKAPFAQPINSALVPSG